ncbi:MAG: 7-cyano-7-deazaguanine synthase [Dehalobacter sp.]|nr:7-cyano-7-deazaguanine synthase [Dehalobacter sp.]
MIALNNRKVVLLYSGGIDSTVLLYWLAKRNFIVYPMFINYGQISFPGEFEAIKVILTSDLFNRLLILDVKKIRDIGTGTLCEDYPSDLSSRKEWFIKEFFPNRNLILIALAATYSYRIKCKNISIGLVGQNSYEDTKESFLNEIKIILGMSLGNYEIIAPFTGQPREKVIQEAVRLRVPIEKTFSCNSMGDKHCNFCTSCLDREIALKYWRELLNDKKNITV